MNSAERNAQARLGRLHYAVLKRDCADVRYQLQQGADVIAKNQDGDTALHMLRHPEKRSSLRGASGNGHEEVVILQLGTADKRCFRAVDAAGNTPLMSCLNAPDVHIDVIMTLMELEQEVFVNGIDFDILNNENESALDLAFASGRPDFVEVICSCHYRNGLTVSATST